MYQPVITGPSDSDLTENMDHHFTKMLGVAGKDTEPSFVPTRVFTGARAGYYFGTGSQGVGYYYDPVQSGDNSASLSRKRKLEDTNTVEESPSSSAGGNDLKDIRDVEAYISDAEKKLNVEALTAESLQQTLLLFEKKITKNQKMRMKYPDEPDKFMESEIELHEQILALYSVAASPELYPIMVELKSMASILGMVAHENTDISLAAVGLIQELTDPELFVGGEDAAMELLEALVENQGLELLVQNLGRFDEANEEDAQGVYNTLAIVENLVEIRPEIAVSICEKTNIFKFLLNRMGAKDFDANKFYSAEILSILLQADVSNQRLLCSLPGLNGMDAILQAIFQYRKREPESVEEEECVQDMFLSLCTILMLPEHQDAFRNAEGIELMIRCLKERKFAALSAVKTINFAISGNLSNCERLVDASGLKYVFPYLMGRNLPKLERKKDKKSEKRSVTESAISIVSQMVSMIPYSKDAMYMTRLMSKLSEEEYEKLQRCAELFLQYWDLLEGAERDIVEASLVRDLKRQQRLDEDDEDIDYDSEEARYAKRLEGGLFCLQQLASIIAFSCIGDNKSISLVEATLATEGRSLRDVRFILLEAAAAVRLDRNGSDSSSTNQDDDATNAKLKRTRQQYIEWAAALSALLPDTATPLTVGSSSV